MDYRPKKTLDIWLNDRGCYRKHVAIDETCFFRAVSDQMYNTQIYHEDIRKKTIKFANENRELFKDLDDLQWDEHFDNLEKHLVVCGDIEIQIVSKMFECDFVIIDSTDFKTENVTNNNYEKVITLCKMKDNHYDSVCSKEQINNSGFCQSLVYKLLYENVYGFDNVDNIVQKMLYPEDKNSQKDSGLFDAIFPVETENKDLAKRPPFPYKIAKALDPNQYRNIEFDAWNQTRKEIRLKDWYLGGDDLKVGTKCLLIVENNTLECYIQDLNYHGTENLCFVYVVEWACKEIVEREQLMPMPDAKPWPLPFAISRNITSEDKQPSSEVVEIKAEEPKPSNRKRKYKRRNTNNNNNSAPQNDNNNNGNLVTCLEGCRLVASPQNQQVDENSNVAIVCKEEIKLSENVSYETNNFVSYDTNCVSCENNTENGCNYASEADWENYQTWLSSDVPQCCVPASYPAPYVLPNCMPDYNSQMCMANEHNNTMIHQEKITTVYSKVVEKTYMNNNNVPAPNLNYPPAPNQMQLIPLATEYQSQLLPGPSYPESQLPVFISPSLPEYQHQMVPVPNYQVVPMPPYSDYGPQVSLGPMMPMPPPSPHIPVSPVPMTVPMQMYAPQVPSVCPCYMVLNSVPQPNVLPQPMPMPYLNMSVPDDLGYSVEFEGNSTDTPYPMKSDATGPPSSMWPPGELYY